MAPEIIFCLASLAWHRASPFSDGRRSMLFAHSVAEVMITTAMSAAMQTVFNSGAPRFGLRVLF